jgi:hypothetical protein
MPLQKQKSAALRLAAPLREPDDDLDDLIGPREMRPGELHARYPLPVSAAFVRAARRRGIPTSLAVSVVCERELVVSELAEGAAVAIECLDDAARRERPGAALAELASDYARMLVAAISGPIETQRTQGPAVIPMRLESRLLAPNVVVRLDGGDIDVALWWELAAVVTGATMTEWALRTTLAGVPYRSSAAGQASAAANTAL